MSGFDFGSGPLIHQEDIEIRRSTDPSTGFIVSHYYRRGTNDQVLPPTYHLQKGNAGFVPPATQVEPHED